MNTPPPNPHGIADNEATPPLEELRRTRNKPRSRHTQWRQTKMHRNLGKLDDRVTMQNIDDDAVEDRLLTDEMTFMDIPFPEESDRQREIIEHDAWTLYIAKIRRMYRRDDITPYDDYENDARDIWRALEDEHKMRYMRVARYRFFTSTRYHMTLDEASAAAASSSDEEENAEEVAAPVVPPIMIPVPVDIVSIAENRSRRRRAGRNVRRAMTRRGQ